MSDATWLPNLVGGTSIWKLAVDLNEPKFFDGRLLVPETEGSESLPVTVRWDLSGLVPLKDARATHPNETAAAAKEFQACLDRVAKVFATPNSGFDKYKEAFTVPSLDADSGANYFYSPERQKLYVINWGASPRSMGGKAEYVFGYEDWSKSWGNVGAPPPTSAALKAAALATGTGAAAAVVASVVPAEGDKDKKDEEKKNAKKEEKGRPWWVWPLFGVIVIALILLALFLLKACEDQKLAQNADAGPDAAHVDAAADAAGAEDAAIEAGADAAGSDAADAASDASADASAIGDAGLDGGRDGGKDGGLAADEDDDDDVTGSSGGASSSGGTISSSSGGASSSGGTVIVKSGPGGGAKTSVHRKHYQDAAVSWRVTSGMNKVSRTEQSGHRYDVWLSPGQSFEGVRVEWQDKAGKWHPH